MNDSFMLVIVSDEDFQAHKNANELINIESYPIWRKSHHECLFAPNENDDANWEMRKVHLSIALTQLILKAVISHVNEHSSLYRLDYNEAIDIYPFEHSEVDDVFRPNDAVWNRGATSVYQFVYISSCKNKLASDYLVFVKFWDRDNKILTFCGALLISQEKPVMDRFNHIRKMCGVTDQRLKMHLLDIFSKTHFRIVDLTLNPREQGLRTGTILVLQEYDKPFTVGTRTGLANPPYAKHQYRDFNVYQHSLGMELYQQACLGQYTDAIIFSRDRDGNTVSLLAHKSVLATVPYFKNCFESGMHESANSSLAKLMTPDWVTETTLHDFLFYEYIKNHQILDQLPVKRLFNLLKMADYYAVEELLDAIAAKIENRYATLCGNTILLLLEAIEPLEFLRKKALQSLAVDYIVFNFSEVARMKEFHDLSGWGVYDEIVDAISRATWLKEMGE